MSRQPLNIGWATVSITPHRPICMHGQLYHRVSSYVHDPLYATALAIDNGEEQCVMVSLDQAAIHPRHVEWARKELQGIDGIDAARITFSTTHTHNSSQFFEDPHREAFKKYLGEEILPEIEEPENMMTPEEESRFFHDRLIEVVLEAWRNRRPGGISYASDYAAVGFNRRPVFDLGDGKTESRMYGDCSQDSFLRFEGPVDHTVDMLYTWDMDRRLTGVLVDVPCPSQVYELHRFLTADYWAPARDRIRERLGNVHVLSICGAAGDQNPIDLVRISKNNVRELRDWNAQAGEVFRNFDMALECADIGERIAEAVERGYRKARNTIQTKPELRHIVFDMDFPIRRVSEGEYTEALGRIEAARREFSGRRMTWNDQMKVFEPMGVVNRWNRQNENDRYAIHVSVMRIDRIAIATNPFELFVEYGFRIRARSRADQVFICQLTNGRGMYLPTRAAVSGGSYSSKPVSTLVGPESGDALVERTVAEINRLWE